MRRLRTAALVTALLFGTSLAQEDVTVSIMVGGSSGVELTRQAARTYMEQHPGVTIEVLEGPERTDELLSVYSLFFDRESGVDIMQLDVIWPGEFADFMVDLADYVDEEVLSRYFPTMLENNIVDGKLVALPWFTDAGLLYYRTDLLDKYGFDGPPQTWAELEEMARTIQEGERNAGNESFWGFVWQGNAYEGLTVDALEWIASGGGGTIVSPEGTITVNNPQARAMLERAAGWVDTISLPGVLSFAEEEARNYWQAGNAAFMRNWPYAYSLASAAGSPVAGRFDVAPLPAGDGGGSVAGLGGWGLGVTAYSEHPEIAADVVVYLTSPEVQRLRAVEGSFAPTIPELYDDPEVESAIPFITELREVAENAVARPSAATAPNYREVSRAFYEAVHRVLTGEDTAEEALTVLEADLEEITGLPVESP